MWKRISEVLLLSLIPDPGASNFLDASDGVAAPCSEPTLGITGQQNSGTLKAM